MTELLGVISGSRQSFPSDGPRSHVHDRFACRVLGRLLVLLTVLSLAVGPFSCGRSSLAADQPPPRLARHQWTSLFDGKTLRNWEVVEKFDFKRHGKVCVKERAVVLEMGSPATGIRFKGDFPRTSYELSLEARRVKGSDFFCGVTFPVGDAALTLVCGGWSGMVVGLSSIDGEPAVENETCTYKEFELGRWYPIRIRVTQALVEVWLDEERIIELPTADRKFSLYWEMEPLQPLGICSWVTTGELRGIRYRLVEETPLPGDPFESATAVWHMADDRDSADKKRHLLASGNVQFGQRLEGIHRRGSLRRGGDGMAARCRAGRLATAGTTDREPDHPLNTLTVAVRLQDPSGKWNSALLSKPANDGRPVLSLFAADSGPGSELVCELSTDTTTPAVRLTTPVAEIGPAGWHDLVVRYDGARVELFVDGRVVAEKSARGNLISSGSQPWLIGATSGANPPGGGFRGLIDHAAVWNRALSDEEIEQISGGKEEILQKKRLAEERRARAKHKSSPP